MSGNCRTPASETRYLTARLRKAWFSRAEVRSDGMFASSCSAVSRSAAKWLLPPRK
jgi:hypothetical protein